MCCPQDLHQQYLLLCLSGEIWYTWQKIVSDQFAMAASFSRMLALAALLSLFNVVSSTWIMHRPENVSAQIPQSQLQPALNPIVHQVQKRTRGKANMAYFTNWGIYGANFQPTDIVPDTLTHILYSFADVDPSTGNISLTDSYADIQKQYPGDSSSEPGNNIYGCLKQMYLLKLANRRLKVLLSIGGWTYSQSGHFSFVTDPVIRAKFVISAVQMIENYGFDGIDIDFEYPATPAEGQGFADLYTELRIAFDALAAIKGDKTPYELTAAVSAGYDNYQHLVVPQMNSALSYWNLMAYDYSGSWLTFADNQANVYGGVRTNASTDAAIKYYIASGASASKINMGIPLYGHGFENTKGLGQSYNGSLAERSGNTASRDLFLQGTPLFVHSSAQRRRKLKYLTVAGAHVFENTTDISSYSYDSVTEELISYDTPDIVKMKAQYSVSKGLAGSMFWELSTDKVGSESLVGISANVFGHLDETQNHIRYPSSSWDNIRSNMGQSHPTTTAGDWVASLSLSFRDCPSPRYTDPPMALWKSITGQKFAALEPPSAIGSAYNMSLNLSSIIMLPSRLLARLRQADDLLSPPSVLYDPESVNVPPPLASVSTKAPAGPMFPGPYGFFLSGYMLGLILLAILLHRIQNIVLPSRTSLFRRTRPLSRHGAFRRLYAHILPLDLTNSTTRLALQLPTLYYMSRTLVIWVVMLLQTSRYYPSWESGYVYSLGQWVQGLEVSNVCWWTFCSICATFSVEAFIRSLDGSGLGLLQMNPNTSPFNLIGYAFLLHIYSSRVTHIYRPASLPSRPDEHVIAVMTIPLIQLTIFHILAVRQRWSRHRLFPTALTSLLSLAHFHSTVYSQLHSVQNMFREDLGKATSELMPPTTTVSGEFARPTAPPALASDPMSIYFRPVEASVYPLLSYPNIFETLLLCTIAMTVVLNAVTQLAVTGRVSRPLIGLGIPSGADWTLPYEEDWGVVLLRIGTASLEATGLRGWGNELPGIFVGPRAAEFPEYGQAKLAGNGAVIVSSGFGPVALGQRHPRRGLTNEVRDVNVASARPWSFVTRFVHVRWIKAAIRFLFVAWSSGRNLLVGSWRFVVSGGRTKMWKRAGEKAGDVAPGHETDEQDVEAELDDGDAMYQRFLRQDPISDDDESAEENDTGDISEDEAEDANVGMEAADLFSDLSSAPLLLAHMSSTDSPLTRQRYGSSKEQPRAASPTPAVVPDTDPATESRRNCVICTVENREIVCWPCRCLSMCDACRESLSARSAAHKHRCPCCRQTLILVDSTRAGKRIPDALSKTVPIWCAVVNRAVALRFPEEEEARTWKTTTGLYTPPGAVSAQEHDQIAARVESWAVGLAASSYTLPDLPRPLRPLWITPASGAFPSPPSECIPVICVSASRQAALDRRTGGYAYVQGSGDDHELWGMGLDPDIFWRHQSELLNASRLELPQLVQTLVANRVQDAGSLCKLSRIERVQGRISIAAISDLTLDTPVALAPGKKGQLHLLQQVLPQAIAFAKKNLSSGLRLCIACRDGVDTSPGVALAVLQSFFDDQGDFTAEPSAIISIPPTSSELNGSPGPANKQTIRTRLEWIVASRPEANPARVTLKRVNEFLLTCR
ncbi:unnamed protein product [Mycena citricolor]|uniref:Chitinase n=1 Tax=Mycena citricolor TaxID=2018698 RepID=A0AAD2I0X8_9AGAR|nr:unnamed protein product [Mycena citricolor]